MPPASLRFSSLLLLLFARTLRFTTPTGAGICPGVRVWHPKKGAHPLDVFQTTLAVNVGGSFNVLRLASERK